MAHEKYQECINACHDCAVMCAHCATECLKENDVQRLSICIQLDMECAAICRSAAEVMSMGSPYSERMCDVCADVCQACAEECERHAANSLHCRDCANMCRRCADACLNMVGSHVH